MFNMMKLPVLDMGTPKIEPPRILQKRTIQNDGQAIEQVMVQWANLEPEETTWEHLSFLKKRFPEFFLGARKSLKGKELLRP